jgi:hypothetical protein
MADVIRLVTRRRGDVPPSQPETSVSAATTSMLASGARLVDLAKILSREFGAIESAIDTIGDAETRKQLKQSIESSQDAMLKAMLDLSRHICRVVNGSVRDSVVGTPTSPPQL